MATVLTVDPLPNDAEKAIALVKAMMLGDLARLARVDVLSAEHRMLVYAELIDRGYEYLIHGIPQDDDMSEQPIDGHHRVSGLTVN
jgi:hypothetical protein